MFTDISRLQLISLIQRLENWQFNLEKPTEHEAFYDFNRSSVSNSLAPLIHKYFATLNWSGRGDKFQLLFVFVSGSSYKLFLRTNFSNSRDSQKASYTSHRVYLVLRDVSEESIASNLRVENSACHMATLPPFPFLYSWVFSTGGSVFSHMLSLVLR
jgi:hypothetical protein